MAEPTPIRPDAALPWPEPPANAVYYGLAGDIVAVLAPHTEADPVGMLVTLLAGVGNAIGRNPYVVLDNSRHGLRVWPVLVGPSGSGRKGTALANAGVILSRAEPEWWGRQMGGLSTGEGLIAQVRDEVRGYQPLKTRGAGTFQEEVVLDPGVKDKRLFVVETEFGNVLQVIGRERNTLSSVLRNAWDGRPLTTMTKTSFARATGAHITVTGHITPEEVRELMSDREIANGFGNRFLWICVRRSRLLPLGSRLDDDVLANLSDLLHDVIAHASQLGEIGLDREAEAAYVNAYPLLVTDEPGAVGNLISRSAPMLRRIAAIYAALEVSSVVTLPHLEAALALWGYADASIRHVFGVAPATAATNPYRRTILEALAVGSLTRTEILDLFGRNLKPPEPHATLNTLLEAELITQSFERPRGGIGRSITRFAITDTGRKAVAG